MGPPIRKIRSTWPRFRAGSFETPIGTVQYDKAGDMKSFEFVVYEWHSDGSKTR